MYDANRLETKSRAVRASSPQTWSDAKLEREFAFMDDNGGDPCAVAWCEAIRAEAAKRWGA